MVERRSMMIGVAGIATGGTGLLGAVRLYTTSRGVASSDDADGQCKIKKSGGTTSAIIVKAPLQVSNDTVELNFELRDEQVSALEAWADGAKLTGTTVAAGDSTATLGFARPDGPFKIIVFGNDKKLGYQLFETACNPDGPAVLDDSDS